MGCFFQVSESLAIKQKVSWYFTRDEASRYHLYVAKGRDLAYFVGQVNNEQRMSIIMSSWTDKVGRNNLLVLLLSVIAAVED